MNEKEKQKLIDLMFQMVMVSTSDAVFCKKKRGEKMTWVANNLRDIGYDTHPIGSSWGVLVGSEFRKDIAIKTDNLDN